LLKTLTPLVIGVLGYGNVSRGAQHVFDFLPVQRILPEELKMLIEKRQYTPNYIYLVVFKEEHLVKSIAGTPFDLQDYYQQPEKYQSQFAAYLPYLTILVNGIYWDRRYPRFVTLAALEDLFRQTTRPKLQGIADITCDVNGSIECNIKSTDPGMPAYLYHPLTRQVADGHQGDGIVVLAVDNLPAELPWDASAFFSQQFKKIVPNLIQANYSESFENADFAPEIQPAVIVYRGELTPNYRYLQQYIQ
jgi:alpha-aminoadipic semialdehyde synthase